MKKTFRVFAMLAVAVTVIFAAASSAFAYGESDVFKMVSSSDTSCVVRVDLSRYSPNYLPSSVKEWHVTSWTISDYNNGKVLDSGNYTKDVMLNAYAQGYSTKLKLTVNYSYTYGDYSNTSSSYDTFYTYVNTKPATPLKSNIGVSIFSTQNTGYFNITRNPYATGAEFERVAVNTGNTINYSTKYTSTDYFSVSNNVPYKFRARYYYVNESNGQTYYGDYSDYKYFVKATCSYGNNNSKNGINIKLRGIKNVKYKIFVATSSTGTYKLTRTVTPAAGKKVTYLVNKRGSNSLSKGRTYYYKVVPYIKGYKSETFFTFSSYNTWY